MTLAPMFGGIAGMVPVLKPFLGAFGDEMVKSMMEKMNIHDIVSIDSVIQGKREVYVTMMSVIVKCNRISVFDCEVCDYVW